MKYLKPWIQGDVQHQMVESTSATKTTTYVPKLFNVDPSFQINEVNSFTLAHQPPLSAECPCLPP